MTVYTPPITRRRHGRGHVYRDDHGLKVPSVTTIMGGALAKPALVNWAATVTADYAIDHWDELSEMNLSDRLERLRNARYADRDVTARRGAEVHRLADTLAHGRRVKVPDELAGHVDAYRSFLEDWHVEPVLAAAVVFSDRHGYAGTVDLIADIDHPDTPGRRIRALLDINTSTSSSVVFDETPLQLAAYRYADVWSDDPARPGHKMPPVGFTGVVHVGPHGYSLIPVTARRAEFRAFLAAKAVKAYRDQAGDLVGKPLTPCARSAA